MVGDSTGGTPRGGGASGSSMGCGGVMIGSAGGARSGAGCGGLTGDSDGAPGGELGGFGAFMLISFDTLCLGEPNARGRALFAPRQDMGWGGFASSGSGMNSSASRSGSLIRPAFQSAFACSMRSLRDETKFHQI